MWLGMWFFGGTRVLIHHHERNENELQVICNLKMFFLLFLYSNENLDENFDKEKTVCLTSDNKNVTQLTCVRAG